MTQTFIKDEERYAEWYRLVKHVYEKSPRASLNWSCYRNSGLENKHRKGVVIINSGPRQAVVTASLDDLKRSEEKKLQLATQRTASALNQLIYVREPHNDPKPPLSKTNVTARKRRRKKVLVPG